MVSLRIVLYYMSFRCFARRCFTHASVMRDMYCLRYSLLASQSKLRLVACGGRWAADVNNAIAPSLAPGKVLLIFYASWLPVYACSRLRDQPPVKMSLTVRYKGESSSVCQ